MCVKLDAAVNIAKVRTHCPTSTITNPIHITTLAAGYFSEGKKKDSIRYSVTPAARAA